MFRYLVDKVSSRRILPLDTASTPMIRGTDLNFSWTSPQPDRNLMYHKQNEKILTNAFSTSCFNDFLQGH